MLGVPSTGTEVKSTIQTQYAVVYYQVCGLGQVQIKTFIFLSKYMINTYKNTLLGF